MLLIHKEVEETPRRRTSVPITTVLPRYDSGCVSQTIGFRHVSNTLSATDLGQGQPLPTQDKCHPYFVCDLYSFDRWAWKYLTQSTNYVDLDE